MKIESLSPGQTYETGVKMGRKARPGEIIALSGDLGCGKTVFTQGFAKGLGIREPVTSPTFTIMQIYESGRLPLCHFDVYRLSDAEEMNEIGYEDYFYGDGVSLVEWADLFPELFPEDTVFLSIRKDPARGDDYRLIEIRYAGTDDLIPDEEAPEV